MDAVDGLAGLLAAPRAQGAFLLRSVLAPPFAVAVRDEAPLTVVSLVCGTAWIVPAAGGPVALAPGDLAIVRGPEPYTVADRPDTPVRVVIHPGQVSTDPQGGATVVRTGRYRLRGEVNGRLLRARPPVAVVPADAWSWPLPARLGEEMDRDAPGQEVVLDQLLDLLLITALREWFARPEAAPP